MARDHKAGGHSEPHAARMGELLSSRHRQKGVSGARQLHSNAVAPVVAAQAQNQASQGRDLSTLASLRALWARTPEPAWARRAVGEGVKFCPRAGCLSRARPVGVVALAVRMPRLASRDRMATICPFLAPSPLVMPRCHDANETAGIDQR